MITGLGRWTTIGMVIAGAAAAGWAGGCAKAKHPEEHEQKIEMSQVPSAVQKTLTAEARGANISSVDKEMKDGETVYEADVAIDGKNYEINVAEDGSLISKKLDPEDEQGEKDEHGDKAANHEKGEKDEADEKDAEEKHEKHSAAATTGDVIAATWSERSSFNG